MEFALKLRIPSWARSNRFVPGDLYQYINEKNEMDWFIRVNGAPQQILLESGFAILDRSWKAEDEVELFLPMPVRFNKAHEAVEANQDRIALTRGPLVFCAEGIDIDGPVQNLSLKEIPDQEQLEITPFQEGILKNIVSVNIPMGQAGVARLIPYYAWNNRGNSSMTVWFPFNPN